MADNTPQNVKITYTPAEGISAPDLKDTIKPRTAIAPLNAHVEYDGLETDVSAMVYQQENKVNTTYTDWNITVAANPTSIPASGGQSEITWHAERTKTDTYTSGTVHTTAETASQPSLSFKEGNVDGWSINGLIVTADPNEGTSTRSVTVVVTFNDINKTRELTLSQEAGEIIYQDIEITGAGLQCDDIPASGGTINSGTVTYKQVAGWNGSSQQEITTGAKITFNSVSAPSLGTTVKARSQVGVLEATIELNGKTKKATCPVYQQANTVTESPGTWNPTISVNPNNIPGAGGSAQLTSNCSREIGQRYTSGAGNTRTEDKGAGSYSSSNPDFTISGSTVTVGNYTSSTARMATITATWADINQSASVMITQAGAMISYGDIVIEGSGNMEVDDIPASGGTVNSGRVTYSQTWGYNGSTTGGGTIRETITITGDNSVSAPNLHKEIKSRTQIGTLNATLSVNGKTKQLSAPVYQQENQVSESEGPWIVDIKVDPSNNIPQAGGSVTITGTATRTITKTWTSGDTEQSTETETDVTLKSSSTDFTISGNKVSTGSNTGSNKSTDITVTFPSGASGSTTLTQGAGEITYGDELVIDSFTVDDIPAAGGTIKSGYVTYHLTWGWNGNSTNGGTLTTGATITYSDPVTAPSLGSTSKDRSKVGELTVTVSMHGKKASKKADVYQAANGTGAGSVTGVRLVYRGKSAVTDGGADNTGYEDKIKASGNTGNTSSYNKVLYDVIYTVRYESGSTTDIRINNIKLNTDADWITCDAGASSISLSSRGKTVGDARSGKVWAVYNGVESNKRTVKQEANSITYGELTGGSATATKDIPASGGSTSNIVTSTTPSQTISYTSGETTTGTVKATAWSPEDKNIPSLGEIVKGRTKVFTKTVTFTGEGNKTKKISVDIYQQANTKIVDDWDLQISASPDTIAASGGESTVTATATRSYSFTSGSKGTESGTPTLKETKDDSNAFTLSGNKSGSKVSVGANPNTTERSVTITATIE